MKLLQKVRHHVCRHSVYYIHCVILLLMSLSAVVCWLRCRQCSRTRTVQVVRIRLLAFHRQRRAVNWPSADRQVLTSPAARSLRLPHIAMTSAVAVLRDCWRHYTCASSVLPTNSISRRICTREKDDVRIGPDWERAWFTDVVKL